MAKLAQDLTSKLKADPALVETLKTEAAAKLAAAGSS
jgi:hypothetical protein